MTQIALLLLFVCSALRDVLISVSTPVLWPTGDNKMFVVYYLFSNETTSLFWIYYRYCSMQAGCVPFIRCFYNHNVKQTSHHSLNNRCFRTLFCFSNALLIFFLSSTRCTFLSVCSSIHIFAIIFTNKNSSSRNTTSRDRRQTTL